GRDHRGRRADPHARPRGLPGARRAVLHAHSDGGGVPAHVPPRARDRGAAVGEAHALRPGVTPLHVAVVSHYRLPVTGYGGTERVVVSLVRGLAALGQRVTPLAAPGTRLPELTVLG